MQNLRSAILAAVMLSVFAGCVFVPRRLEPSVVDEVGGATSDRAFRVDISTREEIIAHFGDTENRTDDRRRMAYGSIGSDGTIIWPLFAAFDVPGSRHERTVSRCVELIFDDRGVLRELKRHERSGDLLMNGYDSPIPSDLLQAGYDRYNRKLWADAAMRSTSRATSQP